MFVVVLCCVCSWVLMRICPADSVECIQLRVFIISVRLWLLLVMGPIVMPSVNAHGYIVKVWFNGLDYICPRVPYFNSKCKE